MQAILRVPILQKSAGIGKGGVIVGIHRFGLFSVIFQPIIQQENVGRRPLNRLLANCVIADGNHRAKHDFDVVCLRKFGNCAEIIPDHVRSRGTGIAGDIVCAREDHDGGGMKTDHIRIHAHQHLRRGLPSDTTIDVRLLREILLQLPHVRNGIAKKDNAGRIRGKRLQTHIVFMIASELVPVLKLVGKALSNRRKAAVRFGGSKFFHELSMDDGGQNEQEREAQYSISKQAHGIPPLCLDIIRVLWRHDMTKLRFSIFLFSALWMCMAAVNAQETIKLPAPKTTGGMPLMDALKQRRSIREFSSEKIPMETLSNLLWAAWGVNRTDGHRTAPSARNSQEIDVYVAKSDGLFLYEPKEHQLRKILNEDVRAATGTNEYVKDAALNLIYVADLTRGNLKEADVIEFYSGADTAFLAQNVYLFCASENLATVVRGAINRTDLAKKMNLRPDQKITLAQSVGYPKKK
jgi:nitroreductase